MRKKSKGLPTKKQQDLVIEYQFLVKLLAGFFLQNRPAWQREMYRDDLEGEGFLALTKASRTYDKARLPYPKAYFARAILNSMLKSINKTNKQKKCISVAAAMRDGKLNMSHEIDYLGFAIEDLLPEEKKIAISRFIELKTLRAIAKEHGLNLWEAFYRSQKLAKKLSDALGIQPAWPSRGECNLLDDKKHPDLHKVYDPQLSSPAS